MSVPAAETTSERSDLGLTAAVYVIFACVVLATVARSWKVELQAAGSSPLARAVVAAAVAMSVVTVLVALRWGPRWVARLGPAGLATIGVFGGLHFVVSFLAAQLNSVLFAVAGPFSVFFAGLADEGLRCALLAVPITLAPRTGTAGLSIATVFLLSSVFSGTSGVVAVIFVCTSAALHEGVLALSGVTTSANIGTPTRWALRLGLAIGAANSLKLAVQFAVFGVLYRQFFDAWYVAAVVLLTGFVYGAAGAALGAIWGLRLKETSP